MNVRNLSAQNSFKNSNPAFQRLIMQNLQGDDGCRFPDSLYHEVVNNKEILKLVAEYHTVGKDIYATCDDEGAFTPSYYVSLALEPGRPDTWKGHRSILRIASKDLDTFKADEYLKRPQAMRFLETFNRSLGKFNNEISDKINTFINNDAKKVFNDDISNELDEFVTKRKDDITN